MKSPDLLLTHGYFLYGDPKELQIMKPYPPLGILYLTSHLRSKGFGVEVFDSTFSSMGELFHVLRTSQPSVLGVYANLMTRRNVVEILRVAREAGWRTIVGGPEPGAYIPEYIDAGADVVVMGEGELTAEEVLPLLKLRDLTGLKRVHGIAFRDASGIVCQTPPRMQIADIDAQPWPCRESISMEKYLETWRTHHGAGSVSMITARGCPYHCRWCSHAVYGKTHRRRKPVGVVNELEWILQRYAPDMLWMADDVFTIHHGWLFEFAREMKRRGLKIPFECISRADRLNPQVADALAELGCFRVWIGSESGSQRILDAMQRGVKVEEVQTAVRLCKERNIQTGMFLMWGYEGEDLEDIEATVAHVKKSDPDIFLTTVAYPIKGTPYFDEVASRVVRGGAWTASSDREFRIAGRHSREFYQNADQLLRSEVELSRFLRAPQNSEDSSTAAQLRERIAHARQGMQATIAAREV
ncbi:MAG TPA: radical SAM protein [Terriglobia bacterium]|nr:radical SAM protein [Terriglobia bacterium]